MVVYRYPTVTIKHSVLRHNHRRQMKKDRPGQKNIITAFVLHLHPRTIPAETLRFSLSFGLGGMAALLFLVMVLTGLLQLLTYSPNVETAYNSILQMYSSGAFGGFIRNIHYWAGNLLVIITGLHLLRVFFTGALKDNRRYNWLIGVTLLLLVQFSNFTGYLLPWDQLAFWAVTIFTNMTTYIPLIGSALPQVLRGGHEVGGATLNNFFALHVGILPFLLTLLLLLHFWLIRKNMGLITRDTEDSDKRERVPVNPHLIVREAAVGLLLLALLCLFSALVDAPLDSPANPGASPNPAKAAWYFMGLQELLLHLHPAVAICLVPLIMVIAISSIPFFQNSVLPGGVWFGGRTGGRLALLSFVAAFVCTFLAILADESLLRHVDMADSGSIWIMRGAAPLAAVALLLVICCKLLRKRYTRAETVMAVTTAGLGFICCLTFTGIWLRGPGMKLVLPF